MQAVLRNRHLWVLAVAESVSGLGNWVTMVALLALVVFMEGGGVRESSLLILSGLEPMLLFSPLAGWLADQVNRKGLMIASELVSAL